MPHPLEASARRSIEPGAGDDAPTLVKRFHARGLRRLRDGERARRERRGLERLRAAGLPAPRPLRVERSRGGWALVLEKLPEARTLDALLDGPSSCDAERARSLSESIGALLADLWRAGLTHGDLHAANLLVDAADSVWLVDAASVRARERRRGALAGRDALDLLGSVRERTTPDTRRPGLVRYLRGAGVDEAEVEHLEAAARLHRRRVVLRHLGRWMRKSGRLSRVTLPGGPALASRALDDAAAHAPLDGGRADRLVVRDASPAAWLATARLHEHRLPTVEPLRRALGRPGWSEFGLPDGAQSVDPAEARGTAAFETLAAALADRGLALAAPDATSYLATADGALLLGPGPRLVDRDASEVHP